MTSIATQKGFQVVGWYDNIDEDKRTASNISDGTLLPTEKMAKEYVRFHNIHLSRIKEHNNCLSASIEFCVRLFNEDKERRKDNGQPSR